MIGIVFSRDRALQLDATLKSFLLHCQDPEYVQLNVLYLATGPVHANQYKELALEYKKSLSLRFIPQNNFRSDLLKLLQPTDELDIWNKIRTQIIHMGPILGFLNIYTLSKGPETHVLFMVDDNIFLRSFRLSSIESSLSTYPDALGFSLRLGYNTTYCYAKNSAQSLPSFTLAGEGVLKFDWTMGEFDFNYPLEVSSSIYRFRHLWSLLNRLPFHNPNTLEGRMAANSRYYRQTHPNLLCAEKSIAFCNPINKVQTTWDNRSGSNPKYTSEELATLYNQGYRIDVNAYTGFIPNSCHQEVELFFVNKG